MTAVALGCLRVKRVGPLKRLSENAWHGRIKYTLHKSDWINSKQLGMFH